jgi:membrane-bound inhibitor of C-type lysozyme
MTALNDFVSRYRRQLTVTIGGAVVLGVIAHAVAQPTRQPLYQSVESPLQITQVLPSAAQFGPLIAAASTDETISQARAIVSNIDLGTAADEVESHKSHLQKQAIDIEYEAALAKVETTYEADRERVETDYGNARSDVDAHYDTALVRVENAFNAALEKAEKDYAAEREAAASEPARRVADKAYNDRRDAAGVVYNAGHDAAGKTFNEEREDADLAYNQARQAVDFAYNNAHQSVQDAFGSVVYQDLAFELPEGANDSRTLSASR